MSPSAETGTRLRKPATAMWETFPFKHFCKQGKLCMYELLTTLAYQVTLQNLGHTYIHSLCQILQQCACEIWSFAARVNVSTNLGVFVMLLLFWARAAKHDWGRNKGSSLWPCTWTREPPVWFFFFKTGAETLERTVKPHVWPVRLIKETHDFLCC